MAASVDLARKIESTSVHFMQENQGCYVEIFTDNLFMRSAKLSDTESFVNLYNDPIVMKQLCSGDIRSREKMIESVNRWVTQWQSNNPYAMLTVFNRHTNDFLGGALLHKTTNPGVAELSGLGHQSYWSKGYGTEAAVAIINQYALSLIEHAYSIHGESLKKIEATASPSNIGSIKVLKKLEMTQVATEERYGSSRLLYKKELS